MSHTVSIPRIILSTTIIASLGAISVSHGTQAASAQPRPTWGSLPDTIRTVRIDSTDIPIRVVSSAAPKPSFFILHGTDNPQTAFISGKHALGNQSSEDLEIHNPSLNFVVNRSGDQLTITQAKHPRALTAMIAKAQTESEQGTAPQTDYKSTATLTLGGIPRRPLVTQRMEFTRDGFMPVSRPTYRDSGVSPTHHTYSGSISTDIGFGNSLGIGFAKDLFRGKGLLLSLQNRWFNWSSISAPTPASAKNTPKPLASAPTEPELAQKPPAPVASAPTAPELVEEAQEKPGPASTFTTGEILLDLGSKDTPIQSVQLRTDSASVLAQLTQGLERLHVESNSGNITVRTDPDTRTVIDAHSHTGTVKTELLPPNEGVAPVPAVR